ncbi:phage antirepressor protein [Clostridium tetani]|uniref:KilA protein, putative phage-related DNA binding protein n=2 Tax=root TaxID=1 RepID=Q896D6_CLOTE|nr:kilA protein, putative phage-related DNA binding protein [Clostridium tetani E88]RXI62903.1 phage antirepressor protein [Clostridium tetani]RXI63424.1 phage antirepressor protein [Clostridium tetani]RXI66535.1 phage antirepressor protein [Clostridium tetani]RXI72566.1 phage antirepressor protein [Clostridium tetani]
MKEMNSLRVIDQREVLNKNFKIYGNIENPLFLAKDVAECIEHSKPSVMLEGIDTQEKLKETIFTSGQNREMWFLTEDGLYEVLMQSRKPIAKQFKKKVKEILKDIRKHGMYAKDELLDNPDLLIQVATKLKEEKAKNKMLELQNKQKEQIIGELKPRADYTDRILKNKGLVTITQIAKDYGMTGTGLNKLLHELKVQYKQNDQWLLYKEHSGKGYTHSETIDIVRSDGRPDVKMNTKWTQKGRLFLYNLLRDNGILPTIEQEAEREFACN